VLEKKRRVYKAHASCVGFTFVSQAAVTIEPVSRTSNDWVATTICDPSAQIALPTIGPIGLLSQFYRSTDLEPV
jgi:hypothetical protein